VGGQAPKGTKNSIVKQIKVKYMNLQHLKKISLQKSKEENMYLFNEAIKLPERLQIIIPSTEFKAEPISILVKINKGAEYVLTPLIKDAGFFKSKEINTADIISLEFLSDTKEDYNLYYEARTDAF
jgi:hypothetical protein